MSRDIKFRVWDTIAKQYWHKLKGCTNHGVIVNANGDPGMVCDLGAPGSPEKSISFFMKDRLIVEQFTGLKDRGGNEIWEGDIVGLPIGTDKDCDGLPCPNPEYPHSWWERGEVKYYPELARFGLGFWSPYGGEGYTGRDQAIDTYIRGNEWVVLGNIHENADLLNP